MNVTLNMTKFNDFITYIFFRDQKVDKFLIRKNKLDK